MARIVPGLREIIAPGAADNRQRRGRVLVLGVIMSKRESLSSFLGGAAIGGGLMYLLDPDRGNARRAYLRDQAIGAVHDVRSAADKRVRDLGNRVRGAVFEARAAVRSERVPDEVLVERVRARLGHAVSHPSALEVHAEQGRIVLSGPVLEGEVERLLSRVRALRGVHAVEHRVQVHPQAGNVPGLQGQRSRRRHRAG